MIARHELPPTGAAAQMAAQLSAGIPTLETERLILRALRVEDFAHYAEIACSDHGRGIGGPMSRDDAWRDFTQYAAGWMLHGHGGWTVELRETDAVLGFVLIGLEPGDQEPELGYIFRAGASGQGYATEAAIAARAFGFDTLGLPTLVSYIDRDNTRSVALAKRIGAQHDGVVAYPDEDSAADVYRYVKGGTA
ncbi:MAG: GNAT family N-acetyltransferase [Paracoccaceae bacterium]